MHYTPRVVHSHELNSRTAHGPTNITVSVNSTSSRRCDDGRTELLYQTGSKGACTCHGIGARQNGAAYGHACTSGPWSKDEGTPHLSSNYSSSPQSSIVTGADVVPCGALPTASIFPMTSIPSVTLPKTTCLPSKKSVLTVQIKN